MVDGEGPVAGVVAWFAQRERESADAGTIDDLAGVEHEVGVGCREVEVGGEPSEVAEAMFA